MGNSPAIQVTCANRDNRTGFPVQLSVLRRPTAGIEPVHLARNLQLLRAVTSGRVRNPIIQVLE
jgi:hypothetical protein